MIRELTHMRRIGTAPCNSKIGLFFQRKILMVCILVVNSQLYQNLQNLLLQKQPNQQDFRISDLRYPSNVMSKTHTYRQ